MRDYTDGLIWQSHALGHNHLRLHLYTDEFEVCNPIGSRKNVHKVCAFYYSVGNVELKYRSQLKNIHLACLLKYKCVRQYGYSMLIKDMIRDLKTLESDGIEVIVDQEHFTVNGSVVTVSGDNLSLHALGGFNPVFSSGRICRHCMVCYSNLRKVHSEEQCTLRNEQTHQYHVDSIVADARLKPVYGVYAESPLSSLNYFSPVSCLPPDVMHDILEGVMTLSVELVLKTLVLERVLDMKTVTRCMQTFEYGCSDTTDRPEPLPEDFVTKNKSVSGKAVEKWCLFRLLPLYIGNLVSEDYAVWKLYLLCRRICDYVMAPVVNKNDLPMLEILISHHHQQLAALEAHFTPKVHYLIHYPRLMMLFGSLRPLWSMRFESNHQYFKNMARRVRNFQNITYTLAERYQRRKCCEQAGTNCLGSSYKFPESLKVLSVRKLPKPVTDALCRKFSMPRDVQCRSAKWLTYDGCKLFLNGLLALQSTLNDLPLFVRICYILEYLGLWIVCGRLVVCDSFLEHYHAYSIKETEEWIAITPNEAVTHHPVLSSYRLNDCDIVVLHYVL